MLRVSLVLSLLALASVHGSEAHLSGCGACALTTHSLTRAVSENHHAVLSTLRHEGGSICDHVSDFLGGACHSLVGHFGARSVTDPAFCAASGICSGADAEESAYLSADSRGDDEDFESNIDMLWSLAGGGLEPDNEDKNNAKAEVTAKKNNAGSDLQTDNKGDAEARRRKEVAKAKLEGEKKVAKALKKATDQFHNATKTAIKVAKKKAVAAAKKKWLHSWRQRKWPVNVSVPKKASKLACTDKSLGRMAFRKNSFYGCKTHCVQKCKQCNCREEEKVVEDADCKCFKRVKKEVCDSCCENECAPQWIAFAECERTCEQCDCKVEHGIKVCQSCCKEKCGPKWHKGPI